jgi:hypothetical protein
MEVRDAAAADLFEVARLSCELAALRRRSAFKHYAGSQPISLSRCGRASRVHSVAPRCKPDWVLREMRLASLESPPTG